MKDSSPVENNVTEVILEGGPASLPTELRTCQVCPTTDKIKVPHWGGYEHFERSAAEDAESPVVFRWTRRTRIAE